MAEGVLGATGEREELAESSRESFLALFPDSRTGEEYSAGKRGESVSRFVSSMQAEDFNWG
jgi:hypothetical protein